MEAAGEGYGGRGTQQPSDEVSLQPEWRRRTASTGREQTLTLQPEWRRGKPTASPSPSGTGDEGEKKIEEQKKELEWRSSKVNASSVWEPEWRRSRSDTSATATAYPWNRNYGVKKTVGSSSGGVHRDRNVEELQRNAPSSGIFNILSPIT